MVTTRMNASTSVCLKALGVQDMEVRATSVLLFSGPGGMSVVIGGDAREVTEKSTQAGKGSGREEEVKS